MVNFLLHGLIPWPTLLMILLAAPVAATKTAADEPAPTFDRDIRPILQSYCSKCHGPDNRKAELNLADSANILRGGESGNPSLQPGSADDSPLYELVASGEMPPEKEARPTREQVAMLKSWIDLGAPGLAHNSAQDISLNVVARRVFDIFEWKCLPCHGRRIQQNGLDLRNLDSMLRGGKSGPALVPRDPDASLILQRIHADEMPPFKQRYPFSVKPVSKMELEQIRIWITAGAPQPVYEVLDEEAPPLSDDERGWWAFQSLRPGSPPDITALQQALAPLDAFILVRLQQSQLSLSILASRRVVIRRIYDDLLGLPPAPIDVEAFIADESVDAFERLVDQLLASPRYGERAAQHWLDAAGYAESEGLESADPLLPEMYRYRDYVIQSWNRDTPFDEFLTEQLAGDELQNYQEITELTPQIADNLIATGFLRTAMDSTREPAINFYVNRLQVLHDTVEIVSSNLLALSLRCAKCHSHKYDPISQRDYYRFAAIFSAAYSPQDWLKPAERLRPLLTTKDLARCEKHNSAVNERLAAATKKRNELNDSYLRQLRDMRIAEISPELQEPVRTAFETPTEKRTDAMKKLVADFATKVMPTLGEIPGKFPQYADQIKPLDAEVEQIKAQLLVIPQAHALTDVTADTAPFYLQNRGEWDRRGGQVTPGVPAVLASKLPAYRAVPSIAGTTGRRLALARWLTHPDHPLTSRVLVNRIWRQYFGRGIVATVDDFGRTGQLPSHPELLDYMAMRFINGGWSVKKLHRSLALSATYRQASDVRTAADTIDHENRLWWRMPLRRRDAESVRDGVLLIAESLNEQMYGPSVPTELQSDGQVVTPATAGRQRRSVYMQHRRLTPETILETFDAPRMSVNCLERRPSTVVNQPLLMLHSSFVELQAAHLAVQIRSAVDDQEPTRQITSLYQRVFSRSPAAAELERAQLFLQDLQDLQGNGDLLAELALLLLNTAEFLYID